MKKLRIIWLMRFAAICFPLLAAGAETGARCVLSIEILSDGPGAFTPGDTYVGDYIRIYESRDGWLYAELHEGPHAHTLNGPFAPPRDERFAAGAEYTRETRKFFRELHLTDVDIAEAIADARKKEAADKIGYGGCGCRRVRVTADLEGTKFSLTTEGPGHEVEFHAKYNDRMKDLKKVFDAIAYDYGRRHIFVY